MERDISSYYSGHAEEHDRKWSEEELGDDFLELRDHFLSLVPGNRILDAGCGPGRDTDYFAQQGYDVLGIDLAEDMVEYARNHKRGDYHTMDIRNLEFGDGYFDGIWACASLFFVPKEGMEEEISELRRVLDEDGILYAGLKLGDGPVTKEKWGRRNNLLSHTG